MTNKEYITILKQSFPKDFADGDPFISVLLDLGETDTEVKDE